MDPVAHLPKEPAEERALVEGLRRGRATAFDRTYALHERRVFSFLLRLSGRREVAEDLAQETWIKLAKAAPSLREDTRLLPFIFTVARNAFISWRRWAMLDLSRLVTIGFEATPDLVEPPDALHERSEEIIVLERALQRLSVSEREVLLLVGVEGFEQEEAAKILGVEYAAFRKRLSRARAELQTAMERERSKTKAHRASMAKETA